MEASSEYQGTPQESRGLQTSVWKCTELADLCYISFSRATGKHIRNAESTDHTHTPHRATTWKTRKDHCGCTRPLLTASEGHSCPVFRWDLINCLPNTQPGGRQRNIHPFTSLGRKMKQKGEVACLSLPCEPKVDFTTSCLPTQFSFLQTKALLGSAPGG